MLAPIKDSPGTTLEWARENFTVLEGVSPDRSVFPTPPGVYVVEVQKLPDDARQIAGDFIVDPIITVLSEPLIVFNSSADVTAQLSHPDVYPGSVRLYLNNRRSLVTGVDFSVDYLTGEVSFLKTTPAGDSIFADYRYQLPQQGPFPFYRDWTDTASIPGAILAFGDRVQAKDQMAIVVTSDRTEVAEVYGGKFEITFNLVVFSRDAEDRERMSDYIIAKFLERQSELGFDGLELLDISPGGENEEVYNTEIDDYYYESAVNLSLRVDWEMWYPLPIVINRAELTSQQTEIQSGYLDGTASYDLLSIATQMGIGAIPVKIGKTLTYERVL